MPPHCVTLGRTLHPTPALLTATKLILLKSGNQYNSPPKSSLKIAVGPPFRAKKPGTTRTVEAAPRPLCASANVCPLPASSGGRANPASFCWGLVPRSPATGEPRGPLPGKPGSIRVLPDRDLGTPQIRVKGTRAEEQRRRTREGGKRRGPKFSFPSPGKHAEIHTRPFGKGFKPTRHFLSEVSEGRYVWRSPGPHRDVLPSGGLRGSRLRVGLVSMPLPMEDPG